LKRAWLAAASVALCPWMTAHAAVPGFWVGDEVGSPQITGGRILIAQDDTQWTLTVSSRVDSSSTTLGMLIPHAAPDTAQMRLAQPDAITAIDAFTAPRMEALDCQDLADRTYLYTAPGCRTHEKPQLEPMDSREASETLSALSTRTALHTSIDSVSSDPQGPYLLLEDWLEREGLVAPMVWPAPMQERLDLGQHFIAVSFSFEEPLVDAWTPPLRFSQSATEASLDLTLGTAMSPEIQDVVIYTVDPPEKGRPEIENYPFAAMQDGCMPSPQAMPGWYEGYLDERLATASLPSWVLEYSGPADACDPCTSPPLADATLLEAGSIVGPSQAWLSRIHMRFPSDLLDRDLSITYVPAPTALDTTFVEHQRSLEFIFPICGVGYLEPAGTCPAFDTPDASSCGTLRANPTWTSFLLLSLIVLARRSRGLAALPHCGGFVVLLMFSDMPAAHAEPMSRPVPRAECVLGPQLVTTPRLSTDTESLHGLSGKRWRLDTHIAVWGSSRTALEIGAGIQGSRTRLGESGTGFTILEPDLGLAIRYGRFDERISPFVRLGGRWVTSMIDTSVWTSHASHSLIIHTDAGMWVGRNARRWSTMLRVSVVPRTDAWQVQFHPTTGMEGWTFLPGYVGASLLFGIAFP
jgi:hypothetical protein